MSRLGFQAKIQLETSGFYPRGGGKAQVIILPVQVLKPFIFLERGELLRIEILSFVANFYVNIAKLQKDPSLKRLYDVCRESKIRTLEIPSVGKGTLILLKAILSKGGCACYSALGAPGKPAERVADEAVDQIFSFLSTPGFVDHYMADQLLLPL